MSTTSKSAPKLLAWHYTVGQKLPMIFASGVLRPTSVGIGATERPALWFSLNQRFEPTALKGRIQNGVQMPMTLGEMQEHGGGVFRFGIEPRRLMHVEALRRATRTNASAWRSLCVSAVALGADPGLWFGTLDPVPVDGLVFEVLDNSRWVDGSDFLPGREV